MWQNLPVGNFAASDEAGSRGQSACRKNVSSLQLRATFQTRARRAGSPSQASIQIALRLSASVSCSSRIEDCFPHARWR